MQGYLPFIGSGPSEAEETRDDPEYVEWYLNYGQAYEQMNGQVCDKHCCCMLEGLQSQLSASMLCCSPLGCASIAVLTRSKSLQRLYLPGLLVLLGNVLCCMTYHSQWRP